MTHHSPYHPSNEETLTALRDEGDYPDFLDATNGVTEDEEETRYARALGYNPLIG